MGRMERSRKGRGGEQRHDFELLHGTLRGSMDPLHDSKTTRSQDATICHWSARQTVPVTWVHDCVRVKSTGTHSNFKDFSKFSEIGSPDGVRGWTGKKRVSRTRSR